VNLDPGLHPVEAVLLSIHNQPFRRGTFLGRLFGRGSREDELGIAPLHVLPFQQVIGTCAAVQSALREDPSLHPLFVDLDRILRKITRPVAQILTQYLQINTAPLAGLADEVLFYLNGVRLMRRLTDGGLPLCRPEIAPMEDRVCEIDGLYNINLAVDQANAGKWADLRKAIICIDVRFGGEGRIFILTGPNRGGKTVFTQAVGLTQVMFQAGLHVPGSRARISPAEGIYAHFPAAGAPVWKPAAWGRKPRASNGSSAGSPATAWSCSTSRFRPPVRANASIWRATSSAPCACSAHGRSTRRICTNSANVDPINQDTPDDSLVASLVTGSEHVSAQEGGAESAQRTFRIRPGPPQGISYARDIARQCGIELHQLIETLKKRKTLPG
jgi:DNA mismatch repair protein MutS